MSPIRHFSRFTLFLITAGWLAAQSPATESTRPRADLSALARPEPKTVPEEKTEPKIPARTPDTKPEAEPEIIRTIRIPAVYGLRLAQAPGGEETLREDIEARWAELNRQTGPEMILHSLYTYNASERIDRRGVTADLPLPGEWRLALNLTRTRYDLDEAGSLTRDADLLEGRIRFQTPRHRGWSAAIGLQAYEGSNADGLGPNVEAGWENDRGFALRLRASAWAPWSDSTPAMEEDGFLHDGRLNLRLPLSRRWALSGEVGATHYELGDDGASGAQKAGTGWDWTARLDCALLTIPGRSLAEGFLSPDGPSPDFLGSGLTLYGEASQKRYNMTPGFEAVPVTERTNVLRIGAEGSLTITRHIGVTVSGYIGQDDVREIVWNQLYGGSFRLILLPCQRLRLWLEGGLDTESSNGIAAGRTQRLGGGLNVNF